MSEDDKRTLLAVLIVGVAMMLLAVLLVVIANAEPHDPVDRSSYWLDMQELSRGAGEVTIPSDSAVTFRLLTVPKEAVTWETRPVMSGCIPTWTRLYVNGTPWRLLEIASEPKVEVYVEKDGCGNVRLVTDPKP